MYGPQYESCLTIKCSGTETGHSAGLACDTTVIVTNCHDYRCTFNVCSFYFVPLNATYSALLMHEMPADTNWTDPPDRTVGEVAAPARRIAGQLQDFRFKA
jgi:hypothetical protein